MSNVRSDWAKARLLNVNRNQVEFASANLGGSVVTVALARGGTSFGASFCSPKDSNDRHIGQAIALERLVAFKTREVGQFCGDLEQKNLHGGNALCSAVSVLAESVPEFFERRQDLLREVAEWQARVRLAKASAIGA